MMFVAGFLVGVSAAVVFEWQMPLVCKLRQLWRSH